MTPHASTQQAQRALSNDAEPFEVRVACPTCRIEGARFEIWTPGAACCVLGVPESASCRLCAEAEVGQVNEGRATLVRTRPGAPLESVAELEQALERWALTEGFRSANELVESSFVLPDVQTIFEACRRGETIETTFDVVDFLFGGVIATQHGDDTLIDACAPSERAPATLSMRRIGGPRDELLALATIAAADGEANAGDQSMLMRAAEARQIPPLDVHDIRVWRPAELPPPPTLPRREEVLQEMFRLAWSDGHMDDSELRLILDYARAWGIDPVRVNEWVELYSLADKHPIARWLGRFTRFLFPTE